MLYVPFLPAWSTCPRAHVPMCQNRANFSFLRANVPINVPACQKAYQLFNLACQRAKWRANFSFWPANVPKGVPIFQTFLLRNPNGNFYTLLLYKKFYIILDIIVIHMISICIVRKNCIILHFYISCHTKEKCAEFLFFGNFFVL